jgi:hypothetical protein
VTVFGYRFADVLYGRDAELAEVDRLLADAREGRSGVLVVRGQAGIGKSAILAYAAATAADAGRSVVLHGVGTESEVELPFAGLHLLLRPALDRIDLLPGPQAAAIRGAFGLAEAGAGDPFLVGLAVLSLLTELAGDGPLLCLVDDAQWLDAVSAAALTFAARRLDAEGVVMIFAARDGSGFAAPGVPELLLRGLDRDAAAALLAAGGPRHVDRERVLDEAGGNPLALLELPALLAGENHLGPFGPPAGENHLGPFGPPAGESTPPGRVQAAFERQVRTLPEPTRTLLLVAAAEGSGDLGVVLTAAGALGARLDDLEPAEHATLIEVTPGVLRFRHPLIRAAAYRCATAVRRLAAHRALAAALDSGETADRRA